MKRLLSIALSITLLAGVVQNASAGSCSSHAQSSSASSERTSIIQTALAAGSFSTLTTALAKADLLDALSGRGPFTVFAPTNEAFAKLPKRTLNALLEDPEALAGILTYHVVEGRVKAKDALRLEEAATLNGQSLSFARARGTVHVNDADVLQADIDCDNGVIHVIDSVLLPN